MSSLANDLDRVMGQVDQVTATLLEQTVRDALALAQRTGSARDAVDSMGYPIGYFESTAGSFANEPLNAPQDFEPQPREWW
jgi:hypothetical protein